MSLLSEFVVCKYSGMYNIEVLPLSVFTNTCREDGEILGRECKTYLV